MALVSRFNKDRSALARTSRHETVSGSNDSSRSVGHSESEEPDEPDDVVEVAAVEDADDSVVEETSVGVGVGEEVLSVVGGMAELVDSVEVG
ncbi:hypothetical protein OGATHE_002722 [Ogataea polymorpha]|uniref:Uncharacterized protein n=1 Tax=Ogataea polymorpha TaxID=460523 RepID=A0A9P8PE51_9ASCO|nr:hypothetical protein OGATHE_002722 [Ogataea polymorpha]